MIVLNVGLLKNEIVSWSEKDIEVLEILSHHNGQIEDEYYNAYKHFGIF
jgi:hypothetical protein